MFQFFQLYRLSVEMMSVVLASKALRQLSAALKPLLWSSLDGYRVGAGHHSLHVLKMH